MAGQDLSNLFISHDMAPIIAADVFSSSSHS